MGHVIDATLELLAMTDALSPMNQAATQKALGSMPIYGRF